MNVKKVIIIHHIKQYYKLHNTHTPYTLTTVLQYILAVHFTLWRASRFIKFLKQHIVLLLEQLLSLFTACV